MTESLQWIGLFLGAAVLAALLGALVAPLESLGWWAGWFGRGPDEYPPDLPAGPAGEPEVDRAGGAGPVPGETPHEPSCWIVYLSGVGSLSGEQRTRREVAFLHALDERLPGAAVVSDVFPYGPGGLPLTRRRTMSGLWRQLGRLRRTPVRAVLMVVQLRNMFQVLVSADSRYGPLYNYALARQILAGLARAGRRRGVRTPVIVIGTSGGGQIAVGAASYLKSLLASPVEVVSIGGVIASDPGLLRVDRVTHVRGSLDRVQSLGGIVFPARWGINRGSAWQRGRRSGTVRVIDVGPVAHRGHGGYFDTVSHMPDGRSPQEHVLDIVADRVAALQAVSPT